MRAQSPKSGTRHPTVGTIAPIPSGALDDLAVFALVARYASFVEASRRAAIPTSSVSRAVARLEERLGVRVLQRTTRQVAVTEEGRQLLLRAAHHLDGLQEALASAADRRAEPSGRLRVTAPAFTGATRIAHALAAFALAHPKVVVELDPTNVIRDLIEDGFDFGVRVGPVVDADFVARRLWQGAFAIFATRAFARKRMSTRTLLTRSILERSPCIVSRPTATWRFRDAGGASVEVTPAARFVVSDPRAAVDVARQGVGFVLAPVEAAGAETEGLVRLRTDFGEPEPVDLYVVYPTRRLLPQRVRMAIDWLLLPEYAPTRSS